MQCFSKHWETCSICSGLSLQAIVTQKEKYLLQEDLFVFLLVTYFIISLCVGVCACVRVRLCTHTHTDTHIFMDYFVGVTTSSLPSVSTLLFYNSLLQQGYLLPLLSSYHLFIPFMAGPIYASPVVPILVCSLTILSIVVVCPNRIVICATCLWCPLHLHNFFYCFISYSI
jgi:hypothetical protein